MFKLQAWDSSHFEADTLEAAEAIARSHLRQWMEPGDRFARCEAKLLNGRRVIIVQVMDMICEPTEAMVVILTPAALVN